MLSRFTLANGLRVLVQPQRQAPRVAVAMHYGVGYRSEPPGREGFAHLFEHLMFRGSASLPNGRFYDHVVRLGGSAGGSTHQDYTDYYQVVPVAGLEPALFAEADRMRAPRFTAAGLTQQLAGVAEEIRQVTVHRPCGGLPWPLLSGVMFEKFANAHDGYGDPVRLQHTTLEDCAGFFDAYYTPGNAVLTLVGGVDPAAARRLVERHFGGIPARTPAPAPDLSEPAPYQDRRARHTEPGISRDALALGYRLPDPATDTPWYLVHTVLAGVLSRRAATTLKLPALSARCGFFGSLDALGPDPLVLTALLPKGMTTREGAEALHDSWADCAETAELPELVSRAAGGLAVQQRRTHAHIENRARALGRLELLFGRPHLLDEVPDMLTAVGPDQVAAAARGLAAAPKAVLEMPRGATRTRPEPVPTGDVRPAADTPDPGAKARPDGAASPGATRRPRGGPLPVPAPSSQPPHRRHDVHDARLPNGLRLVTALDERAPLVELRLRVPLGPLGWAEPAGAEAAFQDLLRELRTAERAETFGGSLLLTVDGESARIEGHAPSEATADWFALLAELVIRTTRLGAGVGGSGVDAAGTTEATGVAGAAGPRAHTGRVRVRRDRTPRESVDDAVRRLWLGAAPAAPTAEGSAQGVLPKLSPRGATLSAVGALRATELVERAQAALADWQGVAPQPVDPASWRHTGQPLLRTRRRLTTAQLVLCAPEPPYSGSEAARFLATAAYASCAGSRVSRRFADWTESVTEPMDVYAGRDLLLGAPRAYVRGTVAGHRGREALDRLHDESELLAREPLTTEELAPVREFCRAQILSTYDSPAKHAGVLGSWVHSGRCPEQLDELAEQLSSVPTEEVAEAAVRLYARPHTSVLDLPRPVAP